jgi:hypothetical protein
MKSERSGMNSRSFLLIAFTALVSLTGCATTPTPIKEARPVPKDRIFLTSDANERGNARVTFIRDGGFTGAGVYQHLFIDGTKAASLDPGETVEFVLRPGEHIFGVVPTDPFGVHAVNTIDQELRSDRQYFYRLQTDGNSMRSFIQRFVPDTGIIQ